MISTTLMKKNLGKYCKLLVIKHKLHSMETSQNVVLIFMKISNILLSGG